MGIRDRIAKAVMGTKAYHSSPHDFDRFDLSKIGTGEGAQSYGHGLYFAENPAVSGQGGQYWNQFLNKFGPDERLGAEFLQSKGFDRNAALAANEANIARLREFYKDSPAEAAPAIARLQKQSEEIASGKLFGPRTYEVNIKADPREMLDWDKRIGQQPPAVQKYFQKQIDQFGPDAAMEAQIKIAGSRAGGLRPVSEGLAQEGIPGIKYLDSMSRGAGTGSSNYVIFDPSIVDIMKKYGVVGAPAGALGMSALADQSRYEVQP